MATSARSITAGDLSQRVSPSDDRTEVGQLGLALNTMLGEIEAAFQERDATEQRLRQFLADASHELRTPLTSIQGFAELFRLGADHDHVDLAVIMRRIEEESARMKTLVDDLLLLARLDETRPVERAPVDLAVLAADACSDAVAVEPDRPVSLDAPEPVVVAGDGDHLRQAIANLVSNALRHTPAGSPSTSARASTTVAVVTVRDHGPGPRRRRPGARLRPLLAGRHRPRRVRARARAVDRGGHRAEHGGPPPPTQARGALFTLDLPLTAPAGTGIRMPIHPEDAEPALRRETSPLVT